MLKMFKRTILSGLIGYSGLSEDEIRRLRAKRGYVGAPTSRSQVLELVQSLKPVSCEHAKLRRLGPKGDGGYLVPDDLTGIAACFSPGVSDVAGFELDCAELGMPVFLADASVSKPPLNHEKFNFIPKYVGASSDTQTMTIAEWVSDVFPHEGRDLIMQMDIEGAEYETLLAIPDNLMRSFRILVVEFHHLEHLWSEPFFKIASATFKKILRDFKCVHIHPNNNCSSFLKEGIAIPPLTEFTFLRSDRIKAFTNVTTLPHPLDSDNTSNPPVILNSQWFS